MSGRKRTIQIKFRVTEQERALIEEKMKLQVKIAEVNAVSEQAADALKDVEKRLSDMALLIKNITTYQQTKPVYDEYCRTRSLYRLSEPVGLILKYCLVNMSGGIGLGRNLVQVAADGVQLPRHGKIVQRGQLFGHIAIDEGPDIAFLGQSYFFGAGMKPCIFFFI